MPEPTGAVGWHFPNGGADWTSGCKQPVTTADALNLEVEAEPPKAGAAVSGRREEMIASQVGLRDRSQMFSMPWSSSPDWSAPD